MARFRLLPVLSLTLPASPALLGGQSTGASGETPTVVVADRTPVLTGAPGAAVYWPGGGDPARGALRRLLGARERVDGGRARLGRPGGHAGAGDVGDARRGAAHPRRGRGAPPPRDRLTAA